jgi:hypothetical protein
MDGSKACTLCLGIVWLGWGRMGWCDRRRVGWNERIGCEVEAKSESGPGLKPREFPERSNHSSLHAKGEERGRRLLRLWPDCVEEDGEEGDEGEEL